jgi:uncharacterized damage-inducible protein DinB
MMILETLSKLFERDLQRLYTEISSYNDENKLWVTDKQIANSAGNLCLHLVGNLNTYIGKILGNTGYIRNREAEFLVKNVPRSELLQKIDETKQVVISTLNSLQKTDLQKEFPEKNFDTMTSVEFMLVHLATHLGYHLGQINYHRRLLDNFKS